MDNQTTKQRAKDKIWSKYMGKINELSKLQEDLRLSNFCGIEKEHLQMVIKGCEEQIEIYSFIFHVLETKT